MHSLLVALLLAASPAPCDPAHPAERNPELRLGRDERAQLGGRLIGEAWRRFDEADAMAREGSKALARAAADEAMGRCLCGGAWSADQPEAVQELRGLCVDRMQRFEAR